MEDVTIFKFQVLFKYRRKFTSYGTIVLYMILITSYLIPADSKENCDVSCENGNCKNGKCVCFPGWTGTSCQSCGGRVRLTDPSGYIHDGAGNYSTDSKCSWLIDSGQDNVPIHFRLKHYATECSWDHLYIYDGDSAFSPLLAAFSGLVVQETLKNQSHSVPEVTTKSGKAFLYFFSDAAYNISGFNISYQIGGCPNNCSGHGSCNGHVCNCSQGWRGVSCSEEICPNDCGRYGRCNYTVGGCYCNTGFLGPRCNLTEKNGTWEQVAYTTSVHIDGRASHRTVLHGDHMWLIGGEHFGGSTFQQIARFDMVNKFWEAVEPSTVINPPKRYGHTLVMIQNDIYMYGGLVGKKQVTNELWKFNINTKDWLLVNQTGLQVVGHTAHYVNGEMIVIFGHSPVFGYLNTVQKCDIVIGSCQLVQTSGAIVKGGYGHTSVYHKDKIYVHGGYHSTAVSTYKISDELYSFETTTNKWVILHSSGQRRYLHSAVVISGLMLVFGGNTHNDTSTSHGAKCHSLNFLGYDLGCDQWYTLPEPRVRGDLARFGHSAEVYDQKMFIYGGFNGLMLGDMFQYTPGKCEKYGTKEDCISTHQGLRCTWLDKCYSLEDAEKMPGTRVEPWCKRKDIGKSYCENFTSCPSCQENTYNCTWCGHHCKSKDNCSSFNGLQDTCSSHDQGAECPYLHNCAACFLASANCTWRDSTKDCFHDGTTDQAVLAEGEVDYQQRCNPPCSSFNDCGNCTSAKCMWCGSENRCVDSNSYVASFPYGQCLEWTTEEKRCAATKCSELRTCEQCQSNPLCGWCDDGSNTGIGHCMEGDNQGPVVRNGSIVLTKPALCPAPSWYFYSCPLCQCNGHSECYNNTAICKKCTQNTQGSQCEICAPGYFGEATNGGICKPCECNGQADFCEHDTGMCHCRTRGVRGNFCEVCDKDNRYYGNPKTGTCFYELPTDYQFTFNLSKEGDRYFTQINFMNKPGTNDRDLEFMINCSKPALMNITVAVDGKPETTRVELHSCLHNYPYKTKFLHKDYNFGEGTNTTFYVYVYNFTTPMWLQISFSQFPQIDLITFFVTFFCCFISLLLIAIIIWKIKIRYVLYLSRQRMFVQMQQMASRPFSIVSLDLQGGNDEEHLQLKEKPLPQPPVDLRKRMKNNLKPCKSSPVAIEPLRGHKAAVLSIVIQLPTGDEDFTPQGQNGLAIGSALVSLGPGIQRERKSSVDHSKSDKSKHKGKQAQSPTSDICV
ncbi:attractin-like isoform X2 [Lingula anatina]|uniref:Attractin-like isoform X2 n=1 Tax=Lingula anatina TaxID=7574 RepID=A0A1S3HJI7_LINAN|nr:attractin-like isoform X2 [Lingula anatina]|eukprot:XP_013386295.1 attractin-like isoform X2 [Lingula anatina]